MSEVLKIEIIRNSVMFIQGQDVLMGPSHYGSNQAVGHIRHSKKGSTCIAEISKGRTGEVIKTASDSPTRH